MEDFSNRYRPEDEYEALENTDAAADTPAEAESADPIAQQSAPAAPVQIPTQPLYQQPQPPVQQPYTPPQQTYYPAYPQQPVQPVRPQPYQQPPVQPQYMPPQNTPVYPQAYQQPQQPAAQQPYQPQTNPYHAPAQPQNPYAQGYSQQQPQPQIPVQQKPATPTGTKVFIIILCALLAMMVIGFIVYVASNSGNNKNLDQNPSGGFSIIDGDEDDGEEINPFGGFLSGSSTGYSEVEDEITLKEDNGETHQRDDDNEASVGKPDESAKNITLNPLPKDKDDEKYSTQSAYTAVSDSVVTVICYEDEITDDESDIVAQGTGTVISSDGYIVTNAHVIGNSRVYLINIVFNSGDKYQAKVIGYDTWTDLAVLKIDAKDLKAVTFGDSDLIEIGDDVIAVGSPGGEKFKNSLTKGIVSAVDRELTINKYVRYIQSDAAISPGNSGGPLCNIYGQVIGITTAKTIATNFENMSFSIPSATVEEIIGDLMHYGYVKGRCRVGISGTEIGAEEVSYYGIPAGVEIGVIDENGPLAGTKIEVGDIITELDGQEITSFQDIYDVLADHKEGDKVTIKVQRPTDN